MIRKQYWPLQAFRQAWKAERTCWGLFPKKNRSMLDYFLTQMFWTKNPKLFWQSSKKILPNLCSCATSRSVPVSGLLNLPSKFSCCFIWYTNRFKIFASSVSGKPWVADDPWFRPKYFSTIRIWILPNIYIHRWRPSVDHCNWTGLVWSDDIHRAFPRRWRNVLPVYLAALTIVDDLYANTRA